MSRRDELSANATRMRARRAAAAAGDAEPKPATAPVVRAKPVRKTVDLPPQRYAALTSWCAATAVELGVSRVTGQDVLNALTERLLQDETLADAIRDDLRKQIADR
jgi:hypothetical protein